MHADDERASLRRDAVVLTSWWVAGGGEGTSGDRLDEEKILILSVAEYFCRRRLDRPLANYQKTAKWGENMGRAVLAILLLTAFGACAGRTPQPVAVVQPQDRYADCGAIIAEVQADNAKISELAGDEGSKVAQNVAAA